MAFRHNQNVMRAVASQRLTISGTSQSITPTNTKTVVARLLLTGTTNNCYFEYTQAATTSAPSKTLIPNTYYDISIHPGEIINFIGTDGTLEFVEMDQ